MGRNGSTDDYRAYRYKCSQCGHRTTRPGRSKPVEPPMRRAIPKSKRYLITGAQNATPVHKGFWAALCVAAKALDAEIIVIPLRYRNPTSLWSASAQGDLTWAEEVLPHLFNGRLALNQNLRVLADVKTVPTASSPLTGMEGLTGRESCILGHTRLQFKTVAVPSGHQAKILTTTGACTVPNYTDSKAGKLGSFHHSLSALIVETDGKFFALRQLLADKDGSFFDVADGEIRKFTHTGIEKHDRIQALNLGDVHVDNVDAKVVEATRDLIAATKPDYIVFNDLLDGESVNPHEKGDPFLALRKHSKHRHIVLAEVKRAIAFVANLTPADSVAIVVSSNHDDFLRRAIVSTDWRLEREPENARFYLTTALAMLDSDISPLAMWAEKLGSSARFLRTDESFTLSGVELSLHGHQGPNGARGSAKNLSRIGTKSTIGHSHSPVIEAGCWQAGTMSRLRLGYNTGPSSWMQTHVIQYENGKRCLIHVIDGRWRL